MISSCMLDPENGSSLKETSAFATVLVRLYWLEQIDWEGINTSPSQTRGDMGLLEEG